MSFPVPPNEAERLRILSEIGLLDSGADPSLDRICQQAREHFRVPICALTLLTHDLQVFKARQGLDSESTPRNVAFCNYTIMSDDVLVVEDALADPRFANNPLVTGAPFIRFYAGAPLIYLREIRLGALCLVDTQPRSFSRGDQAELALLADQVTALIMAGELDLKDAQANAPDWLRLDGDVCKP